MDEAAAPIPRGIVTEAPAEPLARKADRFHRCEWTDPDGRRCARMVEHPLDLNDPPHRVRLSLVKEYDATTGSLVRRTEYD